MNVTHVLLSGGVGSRLWPVSRKSMPKQYIPMFGNKSLFQLAVERNKQFCTRTLIVGNKDNYSLSRSDLQRADIRLYTEVIEAAPRNTAAAIAFAAFASEPNEILLVTPSDHIITNEAKYLSALKSASELAQQGYLVTFGIAPSKAETGYGYIEYKGDDVISFREKPSYEHAQHFVESGNFLWNSGMFCFTAAAYLEDLKKYTPEIYASSLAAWNARSGDFLPETETMEIPSISIDFAVMERSEKIKVVKADFEWSDLGSFESIWEHWESVGEQHHFIKNNCVIGSEKHVEFLGVENLILIETPDAILVLNKNSSQDVKKIYEKLERDRPELVS